MTNNEINEKAEEYARLSPTTDNARRLTLQNEIMIFEYSLVKENGQYVYFPLIRRNNGKIDKDEFYNALLNALCEMFETFNPDKATFTTAFAQRLVFRLADEYKKKSSENRKKGRRWRR